MIVRPGPCCVEFDGQGGGVPIAEVHRVMPLFRELFGVEPQLRMTGRFERGAIGRVPGGDDARDSWDLRRMSGSGYSPVVLVGSEYLYVQALPGLNNGRSLALSPDRGTFVKVRLLLPKP